MHMYVCSMHGENMYSQVFFNGTIHPMLARRLITGILCLGLILFGFSITQDASAHTHSGTCPNEQTLKSCPAGYTDGYLYLPLSTVTCSTFPGAVSTSDKRYHNTTSRHNDLGGYCYKGAPGTRLDGSGITNVGNATRYSSESACQQVACVKAPTPTPTVDLKVNGSDGPVQTGWRTSVKLSWNSTNIRSSYPVCTGSTNPSEQESRWPANRAASGSYTSSLMPKSV